MACRRVLRAVPQRQELRRPGVVGLLRHVSAQERTHCRDECRNSSAHPHVHRTTAGWCGHATAAGADRGSAAARHGAGSGTRAGQPARTGSTEGSGSPRRHEHGSLAPGSNGDECACSPRQTAHRQPGRHQQPSRPRSWWQSVVHAPHRVCDRARTARHAGDELDVHHARRQGRAH